MGNKKKEIIMIPKSAMKLLPPRPGVCQECAMDHKPDFPHNPQSLYYQTKFGMQHDRAATWVDAMAHCSDEMKSFWKTILTEKGVNFAAGEIVPKGA